MGATLHSIVAHFQQLCGLPSVVEVIDGTQIPISKPKHNSVDYFYFKSVGYSINCQAVVDNSKRFLDNLYVYMHGSTNNSCMLRRSLLYHRGQRNTLRDVGASFSGISPYLLGSVGYPLLP